MAIAYPFGLSSVLMTKARTQGASFMQYQPRSGAAYTKNISTDNPVFFNITFRFRQVDAQRFFAWFKGPLQEGRLPFTVPMRTEFGLANQEVRFYAAQGDTILDHSQEGSVHTYTGTVFASSLAYPDGVEDNWDFVASPFWQYRGEWDLALNSITPVAKFIELNFASRFYVKNEFIVNLDEVLSLSRASSGTDFVGGVLTDFAVDEPRVGDGGLLIEQMSENKYKTSKRIVDSSGSTGANSWVNSQPDQYGFITVTGATDQSFPEGAYVDFASSSLLPGNVATLTIEIKKTQSLKSVIRSYSSGNQDGYGTISILVSDTSVTQHPSVSVTDFGDYWKVSLSRLYSQAGTQVLRLYPFGSSAGSSGFMSYRTAQVEMLSFGTSYIPTNGSVEARQQEYATIDISDISERSGSYLIEFDNDGIAYGRCIASAYIDNQNSINAYISQSGQIVMISTKSGLSQSVFVSGTPVVGGCRIGVSYSDSSATISVNGVSQSISGDWSNEMQTVALGMDDHGEMHLNSHISYFKFNPESATEYELNQWTGA